MVWQDHINHTGAACVLLQVGGTAGILAIWLRSTPADGEASGGQQQQQPGWGASPAGGFLLRGSWLWGHLTFQAPGGLGGLGFSASPLPLPPSVCFTGLASAPNTPTSPLAVRAMPDSPVGSSAQGVQSCCAACRPFGLEAPQQHQRRIMGAQASGWLGSRAACCLVCSRPTGVGTPGLCLVPAADTAGLVPSWHRGVGWASAPCACLAQRWPLRLLTELRCMCVSHSGVPNGPLDLLLYSDTGTSLLAK